MYIICTHPIFFNFFSCRIKLCGLVDFPSNTNSSLCAWRRERRQIWKLCLISTGWTQTKWDSDCTSEGLFSPVHRHLLDPVAFICLLWVLSTYGFLCFNPEGYNGVWLRQKSPDSSGSCISFTRRGQTSSAATQAETYQLHTAGESWQMCSM